MGFSHLVCENARHGSSSVYVWGIPKLKLKLFAFLINRLPPERVRVVSYDDPKEAFMARLMSLKVLLFPPPGSE